MLLLITTNKQKAKWAAVESDQNSSTTTQLVKQKAKWAAIEEVNTMLASQHISQQTKNKQKAMREPQSYKQLQRVRTTPGPPP